MKKLDCSRLLLTAFAVATTISLSASNAPAAIGNIIESNNGMILRFQPGGGTPVTLVPDLSNPKGVVFDGNGHFFVADANRGIIYRYNAVDGSQGFIFAQNLNSPVGLTFDVAGNLYSTDAGSGNVYKFDPSMGTRTTFASGLSEPAGLAFDTLGNLFVAGFGDGKIYKIAPDGTRTTFASGLSFPAGLAIDGTSNVFEADSGSNRIFKFTPSGERTTFASNLHTPYGLAFEASGNLIVADKDSGSTFRFTPDGIRSTLFQSDFNTPQFVAVEPAPHEVLNISTRGFVAGDAHNIIAGFIIGGIGPVGTAIAVRALGPSLPSSIVDALQDPVLEVRDASGTLVAANNDWQDATGNQRISPPLEPTNAHEAALRLLLQGGSYTAIVYGAGGSTGTALVEVYHLQNL